MAKFGHIGAFDHDQEDWKSYSERLGHYLSANKIDDAIQKRDVLLSTCGPTTYTLVRNLATPSPPAEPSYEQLIQLLQDHYNPKPSVPVQRFRFNTRCRQSGESIAQFVAALHQLSEHCNFGGSLDDMLRDQLICGVDDRRIQRRLLAETDLDFKRAYELAVAMESAEKDATDLQRAVSVHYVQPDKRSSTLCTRCGGNHSSATCRFKEATCFSCSKKGHLARVCRQRNNSLRTNYVDKMTTEGGETAQDKEDADSYSLFAFKEKQQCWKPYFVELYLNKRPFHMQIDTGSSITLISEAMYQKSLRDVQLQTSTVKLHTYTGEEVPVLGNIVVDVNYKQQTHKLALTVVKGDGPSLLGRDWLEVVNLDWREVNHLSSGSQSTKLQGMLEKYSDVFESKLGEFKGVDVQITVKPDASPQFCKARSVPFVLKEKLDKELDRLLDSGVLEPVKFSKWASPIVPIVKQDGTIRICGDYKLVNKALEQDTYPLPMIEDLFASLSGGKSFTKLDLSHAYQQLSLEEKSRLYTTINTHRGLFQYKRLPFGISSAPSIFQRMMDILLQGLKNVCVYLDDILITGEPKTI